MWRGQIATAMNPESFQTLALGWISAVTALALATGYAVAKVWPVVVEVKTRFDALATRVDDHAEQLKTPVKTITPATDDKPNS